MKDSLFVLIFWWIGWAVFFPRNFGKEMRSTFNKIKEGWNSPPKEKP
jgi:hypothetical protein